MPRLGTRGDSKGVHKWEPDLGAPMPLGHQELPGVFWQGRQQFLLDPRASVSAELLMGCGSVHLWEREAKITSRQRDFGMIQAEWWTAWRVWNNLYSFGFATCTSLFWWAWEGTFASFSMTWSWNNCCVFGKKLYASLFHHFQSHFEVPLVLHLCGEYSSLGPRPLPPSPVMDPNDGVWE